MWHNSNGVNNPLIERVLNMDVEHNEKLVLMALCSHARNDNDIVSPSVDVISQQCKYSRSQTKRILKNLRGSGLIVAVTDGLGGRGKATGYRLHIPTSAVVKTDRVEQTPLEDSRTIWDVFVDEWGTGCWYCGMVKTRSRRELQLDHIEPRLPDGSNDDCWNRALACMDCNGDKGNRLTASATMDRAFAAHRIPTLALRHEQGEAFERRRQWAVRRWECMTGNIENECNSAE